MKTYYTDYEKQVRKLLNEAVGEPTALAVMVSVGSIIAECYVEMRDPAECVASLLEDYGYPN